MLNTYFAQMAKPNCDDKIVQKHADKFNKSIKRNKKILNQSIDMFQYSYVNDLEYIMENLESDSASYKCKVKSLYRG